MGYRENAETGSEPIYTRLMQRGLDDPFVSINAEESRVLTTGEFLGRAVALARQLPDQDYAINLCGNRYNFLLSFCAVIIRGQCNQLPPNKNPGKQREVLADYPASYVIHDGAELIAGVQGVDLRSATIPAQRCDEPPRIPLDQLSAINFTSGSTGKSRPNLKYWSTLQRGGWVNAHHMLEEPEVLHHVLATVPAQHMYGLETSIMLAFSARLCIHDGQPLYPDDIRKQLESMPEPRILVSTPVHLRAMLKSGLDFPPVTLVMSATAPLELDMARDVEHCFKGRLGEIYGCTEVGSIAWRYPTRSSAWRAFNAFHFEDRGESTWLHGDHIVESVELQDVIEFDDDGGFHLRGRSSDMLNIAGKRGSLAELNRILAATTGVEDGVIFVPTGKDSRPVAFVVAPELSERDVIAELRSRVDAVFLPRPVIKVQKLPRGETGKLERQRLDELYAEFRTSRTAAK